MKTLEDIHKERWIEKDGKGHKKCMKEGWEN